MWKYFFLKWHTSKIQQCEKKENINLKKKTYRKRQLWFGNCNQNRIIFITHIKSNISFRLQNCSCTELTEKKEFGITCKSFYFFHQKSREYLLICNENVWLYDWQKRSLERGFETRLPQDIAVRASGEKSHQHERKKKKRQIANWCAYTPWKKTKQSLKKMVESKNCAVLN